MRETFSWNPPPPAVAAFTLHDETLREGLQCPSAVDPPIAQKVQLLRDLAALGVGSACLAMPAAGPRAEADGAALLRALEAEGLPIAPVFAGRTLTEDIAPIARISQGAGRGVEATLFIGSSDVRGRVEGWSLRDLLRHTEGAVAFARREGLSVTFVTEDTTRSHPDTLRALFTAALGAGASRICPSDTVGHALPEGVGALVRFAGEVAAAAGVPAGIDWHGHNDRGLALINSLAALQAGASRLHGTLLGLGERVGNTPLDLLMVNLSLMGRWPGPLVGLPALGDRVAEAFGVPIPAAYPALGRDAFRTATGVHAAAVIKALDRGDPALADEIYSGVPASLLGRRQEIAIGPMSGARSVAHWLRRHGLQGDDARVRALLRAAKAEDRVIEAEDLLALLGTLSGEG